MKFEITLSRGRCSMRQRCLKTVSRTYLTAKEIYLKFFLTVRIFYFISHVRWVLLYELYLYHEY